jgi:hypothetical protein
MTASTEHAILAGGCFRGMQDLLRRYPGVIFTQAGYTGGDVPNATYRNHRTHAEAIASASTVNRSEERSNIASRALARPGSAISCNGRDNSGTETTPFD